MKPQTSMILALALGAVLVPAAQLPARAADSGNSTAAAFAGGGTFCFEYGQQAEGQFQHLKLVSEPATGTAPFNVIPVHGVERGTWKGAIYENTFTGTATETPSASPAKPGPALLMTLYGGGNSYRPDGTSEIWILQYAVELSADTLIGKAVGSETQSGSIVDGKPFTTDGVTAVQKDVMPIDCAKF